MPFHTLLSAARYILILLVKAKGYTVILLWYSTGSTIGLLSAYVNRIMCTCPTLSSSNIDLNTLKKAGIPDILSLPWRKKGFTPDQKGVKYRIFIISCGVFLPDSLL
jgi:hypothetical protein